MREYDKDLLDFYSKEAQKFAAGIHSIKITPLYDDTTPPHSEVVKWIKVEGKDSLPPLDTEVLLWYYIGHRNHRYVGMLRDCNDYEKGYNESRSFVGVHREPLDDYPENMRWLINGHAEKLDKVTYWAKI